MATLVKVRKSLADLGRKYAAHSCITLPSILIRLATLRVEYSKMPVPNVRYCTCSNRMRAKKSRGMVRNRRPRFGNMLTRLNFTHLPSCVAASALLVCGAHKSPKKPAWRNSAKSAGLPSSIVASACIVFAFTRRTMALLNRASVTSLGISRSLDRLPPGRFSIGSFLRWAPDWTSSTNTRRFCISVTY
jgi:hypothetical protein